MTQNGKMLITFAWAIEIVGVTGGIFNSAYTTFGDDLPATLAGYLPALPMLALAVAELGRVPLAAVIFHKHRFIQLLAAAGICALGYLAVENWTFGFERIVDLRLHAVNVASVELSRAEADLASLKQQHFRTTGAGSEKREGIRRALADWDKRIADLTKQLQEQAETHQRNLEQIREACRLIRERCMVPRSQAEDQRFTAELGRLNTELTQQRRERNDLQSQLNSFAQHEARSAAELDERISAAAARVDERRQAFHTAANRNQIYRLAASWFGVKVEHVTAEQFAFARLIFATFSAIAVALAGTVAALVYYSRDRAPVRKQLLSTLFDPLLKARRAYFARKRKQLVREVAGPERIVYRDGASPPTIVEKEVVRLVDRIILIPRFGIRSPTYINRLFGKDDQFPNAKEELEGPSNVMVLAKRGA